MNRARWRRCLHVAGFATGLLATAALVRHVDPLPIRSHNRLRYLDCAAQLPNVDVLFVGSSRFQQGIVPAVFDAAMSERGLAVRSYNFAVSGQRAHDTAETIAWVLDQRPTRLRAMVVELHTYDQRLRGSNWLTAQDVEGHSARQLPARVRTVLGSGVPPGEIASQLQFVFAHTLVNHFCIGAGPAVLEDLVAPPFRADGAYGVVERGYWPAENAVGTFEAERAQQMAADPEYAKGQLGWKLGGGAAAEAAVGWNAAAFAALDARIRAAGIEPFYVTMPTFYADFFGRPTAHAAVAGHSHVDLDRPRERPELFAPALWFDPGHVRRAGAERISVLLAGEFAAMEGWRRVVGSLRTDGEPKFR